MYQPAQFKVTDHAELLAFMQAHSFATLITAPGGVPFATHLPLLIEADGERLFLRSHIARANKQWQHFGDQDVLVIFQGPHALIDPAWYEERDVPTWDYAVVHAYGRPRVVDGEATRQIAYGLVQKYTPGMAPISADSERRQLAAVVTFEIEVTRLEGKYKLSQNRSRADMDSVRGHLLESGNSQERETGAMIGKLLEE